MAELGERILRVRLKKKSQAGRKDEQVKQAEILNSSFIFNIRNHENQSV